jgi:hypothetical protein
MTSLNMLFITQECSKSKESYRVLFQCTNWNEIYNTEDDDGWRNYTLEKTKMSHCLSCYDAYDVFITYKKNSWFAFKRSVSSDCFKIA